MLEYYLKNLFLIHLVELLAAFSGTYYLAINPKAKLAVRLFVYFLWFIFLIEVTGLYSTYFYFNGYENFEFLENSPFVSNYWLYNIFNIFSYCTYFSFFILNLNLEKNRRILIFLTASFVFTAILNLIFSDIFFIAFSGYTHIIGTIILILCISAYYYELLTSDRILNFHTSIEFYISIGALIFHVVSTPLFIYSKYFKLQNPDFITVYDGVLNSVNFFLYGIIIMGFLISSLKRKKESEIVKSIKKKKVPFTG